MLDIVADVRGGAVTLRGIVVDDHEKKLAVEVVSGLAGVKNVSDELSASSRVGSGWPTYTRSALTVSSRRATTSRATTSACPGPATARRNSSTRARPTCTTPPST